MAMIMAQRCRHKEEIRQTDLVFTCLYEEVLNGFSFYMLLQSALHQGKVTGYNQMQCSSSSSQCKKFLLPRVHKEQAPHLRWEQLEPGVVDALSVQKMLKDWLKLIIAAIDSHSISQHTRVAKVSSTNSMDNSTHVGSKLAELRAGKTSWTHTILMFVGSLICLTTSNLCTWVTILIHQDVVDQDCDCGSFFSVEAPRVCFLNTDMCSSESVWCLVNIMQGWHCFGTHAHTLRTSVVAYISL